jgi:hypothetical protein
MDWKHKRRGIQIDIRPDRTRANNSLKKLGECLRKVKDEQLRDELKTLILECLGASREYHKNCMKEIQAILEIENETRIDIVLLTTFDDVIDKLRSKVRKTRGRT